ncbi:MAG: glutamine amidotransferase [Ilumatobacteraceae bacterium]
MNSAAGVLSIAHVYPTVLGLYGDRGNALILERRAAARGINVELLSCGPDQPIPKDCDIYVIGGGEDAAQATATELLRADGGLASAVNRGAVVLAVCAGLQLLGIEFGAHGVRTAGLGLVDVVSTTGDVRAVGEVLTDSAELPLPMLSGFENHLGRTVLGTGVAPFGRVLLGTGNGTSGASGPTSSPADRFDFDGFVAGRVVGTYMHGPVLARNPCFADLLLHWATGLDLADIDDHAADALRAERIAVGRASMSTRRRSSASGWSHRRAA